MTVPTVLLVEDNPDDVDLTLRAFTRNTFVNTIAVARDGVEALDYLLGAGPHAAQPPDLPAVVLLDLKLPKIDGLEVLRRVRADPRARLTPIVVLTSSGEERDILAGYALGANSYIRKPVTFERFVEAVRTLGTYWLLVNQPPPAVSRPTEERR
jgi:two-component system response regulator